MSIVAFIVDVGLNGHPAPGIMGAWHNGYLALLHTVEFDIAVICDHSFMLYW